MRYQLKQIYCRPWTLSGPSLKLIESHYENNHGGALRRLNAVTEQLEALRTAIALRDAGFDARYMTVGHSGWKAVGAPVKMNA